jgi:ketosteroid isomerase-like protein
VTFDMDPAQYITHYGITHPRLPEVIPLIRHHAQAIADSWPGVTVMARTGCRHRGVTGTRAGWTRWQPVPTAPPGQGRARTPEDLPRLLAEHFNAGDLDALLDLYELGAVLAADNQTQARHGALRDTLASNVSLGVPLSIDHTHVLATSDVALLITDWSIAGVDRHGALHSESGRSADVARADGAGHWHYVIDNPAGTNWPELGQAPTPT